MKHMDFRLTYYLCLTNYQIWFFILAEMQKYDNFLITD